MSRRSALNRFRMRRKTPTTRNALPCISLPTRSPAKAVALARNDINAWVWMKKACSATKSGCCGGLLYLGLASAGKGKSALNSSCSYSKGSRSVATTFYAPVSHRVCRSATCLHMGRSLAKILTRMDDKIEEFYSNEQPTLFIFCFVSL